MLGITLLLLSCSLTLSIDIPKPIYNIEHASYYFNDFIRTYNKNYTTAKVKQYRLKIFTENLKELNRKNTIDSAMYRVNEFSDLTKEEFSSMYKGLSSKQPEEATCTLITKVDGNDAPAAFDWRSKNVVTPVKNQQHCGSCYTFSSVGNIESQYAMLHGELLDLSEQQLVDCSKENQKCNGGFMTQCMIDVMDSEGIENESDYPYIAAEGSCKFQKDLAKVKLTGCKNFDLPDEKQLKQALYKNGPISIGIAADQLVHYHGGIITDCPGSVDHAVLLVGYGSENGQDFWTIKNSWGATFGEQGFFRISRGQNTCTIVNNMAASGIVA